MGIVPTFTMQQVHQKFITDIERINEAIIVTLSYLGEKCVNEAKVSGAYTDRTGNLRSSIGYVIAKDGNVISDSFNSIVKIRSIATKSRSKSAKVRATNGADTGKSIAYQLASQTQGVALIVVAGMNYALYVESKGFNVLTTAETLCKREFPRMMKQLIDKAA